MAVCKICNTNGLVWSENIDPTTGKSFLYNENTGTRHNCTERAFCHRCSRAISSYEQAWRHLLQNEYHRVTMWKAMDENTMSAALAMGVPEQVLKSAAQVVVN